MEQIETHTYSWHTAKLRLKQAWQVAWPIVRQVLGWLLIILGILGLVLPLLQGVLFLAIGIALVGRRNPVIRFVSTHFKLFLRRWAAVETPLIRPLGRLALRGQQQLSRQTRRIQQRYAEYRAQRTQSDSEPPMD